MGDLLKWRISVRELAEHVWRQGDLRSAGSGSSMQMGAEGHRRLQRSRLKPYEAEVYLCQEVARGDLVLEISGRLDGVFTAERPQVVEEIKTTTLRPLLISAETNPVHLAQAKLYGAMYAEAHDLEQLDIALTYLNLIDFQLRSFRYRLDRGTLSRFFDDTVSLYLDWLDLVVEWRQARNRALMDLSFPFKTWRSGQQALADQVEITLCAEEPLFAEAPTGSGKTMAVLFGALKSLGVGHVSQVIFLTAKTVGRQAAEAALRQLGVPLKALSLTARSSLCPYPQSTCAAGDCPLARGHFDRLPAATRSLFGCATTDATRIESVARAHDLCSYWLSREMVPWVDVVICDYNYAFDPRARLASLGTKRKLPRALLVDEAHNLVDRAREMFSASHHLSRFQSLDRSLAGNLKVLRASVARIQAAMREVASEVEASRAEVLVLSKVPGRFLEALTDFCKLTERLMAESAGVVFPKTLLDVYFESLAFLRALTRCGREDVLFVRRPAHDVEIKLLSLDPSARLREIREELAARAVFFSATLSPLPYFARVLGAKKDAMQRKWPPLFPSQNCYVAIADTISTRYTHRMETADKVAEIIRVTVRARTGNYLVYFSSYEYLQLIAERLTPIASEMKIVLQRPGQSHSEKEAFLAHFEKRRRKSLVALAVQGGLFGEGIDLTGTRLIGAIVVGPGLPKVSPERALISRYYDSAIGAGFDFAYRFPGMNKVIQAAGRVIRSETDQGVILFVDERFSEAAYFSLLKEKWPHITRVRDPAVLAHELSAFWATH